MQLWILPVVAFFIGSIPFGLLIGRARGIDIREHGSGNIGATNVLRIVGRKYGVTCLFLDLLKGFIPVVVAINLVRIDGRAPGIPLEFLGGFAQVLPAADQFTAQLLHVLTGLAAVLGHNYSPWVGFRGGKGIATSAGILLALMPAAVVILLVVFGIGFLVTRYVSLASVIAAVVLPLVTHLGARFHKGPDGRSLWEAGTWNKPLFALTLVLAILAVWKHRSNLRRIAAGTENRLHKTRP
jgi:glycerol-3-phosphate acyltransferase PlsY